MTNKTSEVGLFKSPGKKREKITDGSVWVRNITSGVGELTF